MKRGKQTCRIRKQIAEANDVEFITSECQYQGDCLGTCPKCESEVRYLEQQLEYRRIAGKAITILGISTSAIAMIPLVSSCTNSVNKATSQEVVNDTVKGDPNLAIQGEEPVTPIGIDSSSIKKEIIVPKISQKGKGINNKMSKIKISLSGYIPSQEDEIEIAETDTANMVEQMPQFPGGQKELMDFFSKSIEYPERTQGNGIQGRVIVQFVVNKDASILNPRIMRGVDPYLDKEALRIIKLMPKWIPGVHKGKNVMVRFTVPVIFRLQ